VVMHSVHTPVFEAILNRRSIRSFTEEAVDRETLLRIITAGTWAPSGLNNQPWRFAIVWDGKLKRKLAKLTRYSSIIENAAVLVAVFLGFVICI